MPGLINILQTVKSETDQEQQLRASCYDAIGYILTSVKSKPEICKQDAVVICQSIVTLMNSGQLKASDPQQSAIQDCIAQICVCLKADFKPFLSSIVPLLKKDMELDVKFSFGEADPAEIQNERGEEKEDGIASMQLKIKGLEGVKQVQMDTYALESKIQSLSVCKDIARNMGTAFYDYVEDVAEICIGKLMKDRLSISIRSQSAKLMRFCVAACEEHPERQRALFIMSYMVLMEELDFYQ